MHFEEVGGGGRVEDGRATAGGSGCGGRSSRQSAGTMLKRAGAGRRPGQFFAHRDQFAVQASGARPCSLWPRMLTSKKWSR